MNDADVQVIYCDVDRETNTVRVTLKVPKGTDPETIKNTQEDYR